MRTCGTRCAEEYNGDTLGMYIGGTIGTLMMVAMILWGGM